MVGSAIVADRDFLGLVSAGNIRAVHGDPKFWWTKEILIIADRDKAKRCRGGLLDDPAEAAPKVVIRLVEIPETVEGRTADLNDLHREQGLRAVRKALRPTLIRV